MFAGSIVFDIYIKYFPYCGLTLQVDYITTTTTPHDVLFVFNAVASRFDLFITRFYCGR